MNATTGKHPVRRSNQLPTETNPTSRAPLGPSATIKVQWPSGAIDTVSSVAEAIQELRTCHLPAVGLLNALNEEHTDWIFRIGFERQVGRTRSSFVKTYLSLQSLLFLKA